MNNKSCSRINGFEQIKAFYSWVFNEPEKARPTHISLYLFLLNQNNRANWVEWFKCPYDLAMHGARIGNKGTYYNCLNDLKEWEIIDYIKGQNNFKAPLIKLFVLYESEPLTEQVTVPLSEPQSVPLTVPLPVPLTGKKYKLLTDNLKQITDNLENIIEFLNSDLIKEEEKETTEFYPFEEFWEDYDKKRGDKEKLKIKWKSVSKSDREKIKIFIPKYKMSQPDKQYQKDPSTFLTQKAWNDEIIINQKIIKNGKTTIDESGIGTKDKYFAAAGQSVH